MNPSGKCSYERPTRDTVCGTIRSMCGADAGCLAINYQSLCVGVIGVEQWAEVRADISSEETGRERERGRETEKERGREGEREREKEIDRERERERVSESEKGGERER